MSNNKPSDELELIKESYKPLFPSPSYKPLFPSPPKGQTSPPPNNGNTGQQSTPNTDNGTKKITP